MVVGQLMERTIRNEVVEGRDGLVEEGKGVADVRMHLSSKYIST